MISQSDIARRFVPRPGRLMKEASGAGLMEALESRLLLSGIVPLAQSSGFGQAMPGLRAALSVVTPPPPAEVSIAATTATTLEGNAAKPGVITFTRTGGTLSQPLTVSYTITGTAANGTDYDSATPLTGSVTFAANSKTAVIDVIPVISGLADGPKTVTVTLNPDPGNAGAVPVVSNPSFEAVDLSTMGVFPGYLSDNPGSMPGWTSSEPDSTGINPVPLGEAGG